MLDKVLQVNSKNEKALMRKCQCFIELVEYDKANGVLKLLEEVAFQSENSQSVYQEIKSLKQ